MFVSKKAAHEFETSFEQLNTSQQISEDNSDSSFDSPNTSYVKEMNKPRKTPALSVSNQKPSRLGNCWKFITGKSGT
jgi:hypothetical protein